MGIDSTTETLESYFHPDSSKDMKLQERQTVVVVVFLIFSHRWVSLLHRRGSRRAKTLRRGKCCDEREIITDAEDCADE